MEMSHERDGRKEKDAESKPNAKAVPDGNDHVQRGAGSAALAVSGAILQAKLTVGPAVDPFEREADQVADRVVRSLSGGSKGGKGVERSDESARPVAQRVQRAATAVGAAGGAVDGDTERAIQSSRGGGRAMPSEARRSMEGAFGADFSGIRVHEGAKATELSNRIQAKAFTVGSDVFFRDGMPDTGSSSGQHLLAHELTHTIQQGGAVARSTDTADSPASKVQRAPASVQRLAEARLPVGAFSYEASASAVLKAKRKNLFPAGSIVRVDDGGPLPADDDPGSQYMKVLSVSPPKGVAIGPAPVAPPKKKAWWKRGTPAPPAADLPVASKHGWFPAAMINSGPGGEGWEVDPIELLQGANSPVEMMGDVADDLGADGDKLLVGKTENNMGVAAGAGGVAGGLLGLAASIQAWRKAESGGERADAAIDAVESVGAGATGVATIIKSASDAQKGSGAADAVGGLGMFGSIFAGIKSTYELVKEAINLAKDAQNMTGQEKTESIMAMITSLLEAAASGVGAAKTFLDSFGGGANEALKNSVPGFGIAIGVVDMIVRSVALVKALVQKSRMRTDKHTKKVGLKITLPDGREVEGEKGKKFEAATLYKKLSKKNDDKPKSIDAAGVETLGACSQKDLDFLAACDGNPQFQEYLFSKGLQYINQKRANRAVLKMAVAMGQIAGDVATLGGASAPVGIGLKAGAMALDVGSSVFRSQKQYFRDMKAKKEASGGGEITTGFLSLYNSEKNSGSKLKEYNGMVDRIFDMIVKSSRLEAPAPPPPGVKKPPDPRFVGVIKYLDAVGISMTRVRSFENDPAGLRKAMIESLQKRE